MRAARGRLHLLIRGKTSNGACRHDEEVSISARDRDSLWHQITDANQHMSEVSAGHNALQQEMMSRTACKSCDDSTMNSQSRTRPESRQLRNQIH